MSLQKTREGDPWKRNEKGQIFSMRRRLILCEGRLREKYAQQGIQAAHRIKKAHTKEKTREGNSYPLFSIPCFPSLLFVSLIKEKGHYKQPSRVLFFFPYPFFLKRVGLCMLSLAALTGCCPYLR